MKEEFDLVKKENADLEEQLQHQEQRVTFSVTRMTLNSTTAVGTSLFNVQEKTGETPDDCARTCCQIFTEGIGVLVKEEDLEAAYQTGPVVAGRKWTIIV